MVRAQQQQVIFWKATCVLKNVGVVAVVDVQQSIIGSCRLEDVAVKVLTRVIGHCPHRNQLLIDCGWSGLRCRHHTPELLSQHTLSY